MIAIRESHDSTDSTLRAEPIDRIDANEPIDPIENADPTEPIDIKELRLRIDRIEFVDL